jgi:hypothetical protein
MMSKYWHIEDGQVCWRTPYADLRGCDGTMLVACLNERDEKIADLKKQLADVKNYCNYYMKRSNDLVLKLAESEENCFDLQQRLADKEEQCRECKHLNKKIELNIKNKLLIENEQFKQQLAEKEMRIKKLNLEAQRYYEDAYCNNFQIKTKTDFAIEQLEKTKYNLLDVSNGWWLCFKDGTQYMTHRELEGCVKEVIDNQIKEFRGQK